MSGDDDGDGDGEPPEGLPRLVAVYSFGGRCCPLPELHALFFECLGGGLQFP